MSILNLLAIFSFLLLINNTSFAMNTKSSSVESFVRVTDNKIQTARKTYINKTGEKITLLGASHLGEKKYFDQINKILKQDCLVLYEGKGRDKAGLEFINTKTGKQNELITNHHLVAATAFSLCYQLNCVDYSNQNFIHADYTLSEVVIAEKFKNIDDFENKIIENIKEIKTKYSPNQTNSCKFYFDSQVNNLRKNMSLNSYCTQLESYLTMSEEELKLSVFENNKELYDREVINRNKIVIDKLALILGEDKKTKNHIIIYYGAAHLSYFAREICNKYDFVPETEEWLTAISY